MHKFMFRYCHSHCYLLHKFTSGYPNGASSGFIFDAETGTLLLYPVYYEISGGVMFVILFLPNSCYIQLIGALTLF